MEEKKKDKQKPDYGKVFDLFKSKDIILLAVISAPSGLRTRVHEAMKDLPPAQKRQVVALLNGVIEEMKI